MGATKGLGSGARVLFAAHDLGLARSGSKPPQALLCWASAASLSAGHGHATAAQAGEDGEGWWAWVKEQLGGATPLAPPAAVPLPLTKLTCKLRGTGCARSAADHRLPQNAVKGSSSSALM